MKRILITGVSSFIGVHLARYFSNEEYHVINTISKDISNYQGIQKTRIESLLNNDDEIRKLDLTNKLLGRNWSINGHVKKGKRIGKKLGFPTCNIDIKNYILAKPGVYGVKVRIKNSKKLINGIANLGYRPTFGGKNVILEVNLFNIKRNLYKKELTVYFQKFVRNEKKFKNKDQLIKRIFKDIQIAKNSFKNKVIL